MQKYSRKWPMSYNSQHAFSFIHWNFLYLLDLTEVQQILSKRRNFSFLVKTIP